jgi:hypothetical protein
MVARVGNHYFLEDYRLDLLALRAGTGRRTCLLSNDWAQWYCWGVDSKTTSFQNVETGYFARKTPEKRYGTGTQRRGTSNRTSAS